MDPLQPQIVILEGRDPQQTEVRLQDQRIGIPAFDCLPERLAKKWGRRANFCIDAAGRQLVKAMEFAEYRGTILCFAGAGVAEEGWNFSAIQAKELTIMGSFIINDSMHRAVSVLESGLLDLDPVVTHEIGLEELDRGIALMKSGEGMEIVVRVGV
jgi:threonine dehydrogenase-like Zn-dependent dehydrogenase